MHIARTRRRTCRLECARRARVLGEHPDRVGATHRNPSVRCKKHAAGFRNAIGSCDDYIYGSGTTPVAEVNLNSSIPGFMTYTPSDSSWLITNAAGDETAFYGYDAFGNLAFGTPESPFGYAGEYTDPSTGLSDLRARWYEPQTGSFTTRDPAFTSTDTAYTYANDDPVNGSDPTGLSASCVHSCLAEVSTTAANDIDRHPQMAYVFQDMSTQWDDIVVPYASQLQNDFANLGHVPALGSWASVILKSAKLLQFWQQIAPGIVHVTWNFAFGALSTTPYNRNPGVPESEVYNGGTVPSFTIQQFEVTPVPVYVWFTDMLYALAAGDIASTASDFYVDQVKDQITDALGEASVTVSTPQTYPRCSAAQSPAQGVVV